ncbi:RNA polymerase sigma factor [Ekhidna sp.]|uniref:RNA polymerase sigma factor n=1 Tax=Ekhidna sp. TaxID=2608089 RepID=UPI003B500F8B
MKETNQTAFQELFDKYRSMVAQLCLGYASGDYDLANDLTQEVFINTWNAMDRFEGRSSYKTWIYRITVNTCLQYHRKNKKQKHSPIGEVEVGIEVEETGLKEERANDLYKAIDQLNKIDRLIITMVLEELEYEEIAEVIGISETNLRVKIHRIKKRLKKLMSNG